MSASHPDQAAPDAVAAELAPDLAAIIAHLVTGAGDAGQPAVLAGALDRAHDMLAGFHEEALAWAAGAGPVPAWQSWANRLALALGELAGALDPPPDREAAGDGVGRAGARRGQGPPVRRAR